MHARILAYLALGRLDEAEALFVAGDFGAAGVPEFMTILALQIPAAGGRAGEWARLRPSLGNDLGRVPVGAAVFGDRTTANRVAAEIDSWTLGPLILLRVTDRCGCGKPFDLSASPNLARLLREGGLPWAPPAPIRFPLKAARIYFGSASAGETFGAASVSLLLPAPVRTVSNFHSQSFFGAPGDFNDDGIDDIVVAVSDDLDPSGSGSFERAGVYVVFGKAAPGAWSSSVDLSTAADRIFRPSLVDQSGGSVIFPAGEEIRAMNAGDVDADGAEDLAVLVGKEVHVFKGGPGFGFGTGFTADFNDIAGTSFPDFDHVGVGRDDAKREGEHMAIFYKKSRRA